jgi:hypothetical protein
MDDFSPIFSGPQNNPELFMPSKYLFNSSNIPFEYYNIVSSCFILGSAVKKELSIEFSILNEGYSISEN